MLALFSGPGYSVQALEQFIGSHGGWGWLGIVWRDYGVSLVAGVLVLGIGYRRRWHGSHLGLPMLFWAFDASLVHAHFLRNLPLHPIVVSGRQVHGVLALAVVLVLVSVAVYRARVSVPLRVSGGASGLKIYSELMHGATILSAGLSVATVFLDWAMLSMALQPFRPSLHGRNGCSWRSPAASLRGLRLPRPAFSENR